jgi:hypothetical protein
MGNHTSFAVSIRVSCGHDLFEGQTRMCVDYRALNTFTVPISYRMPRTAEKPFAS